MRLAFKDFNEKQRQEFVDAFPYVEDCVPGNPFPWCCPWDYAGDDSISGDTIKEMSLNWYDMVANEIRYEEEG